MFKNILLAGMMPKDGNKFKNQIFPKKPCINLRLEMVHIYII